MIRLTKLYFNNANVVTWGIFTIEYVVEIWCTALHRKRRLESLFGFDIGLDDLYIDRCISKFYLKEKAGELCLRAQDPRLCSTVQFSSAKQYIT